MPLSDHALLFISARLKQTTVRCLSWNMMAHRVTCNDVGIDDVQLDQTHGQAAYRYSQIARHLAEQAQARDVQLIALQEVTHQALRPHLEASFPKESWWYVEPEPLPAVGVMSLVSKRHFLLSDQAYDRVFRTQSFTLQSRTTQESLRVHNVWTPYSFMPQQHETYYRGLMAGNSILLGDTNSRVLPLPHHLTAKGMIATGVIPPIFKADYKKGREGEVVLDHSDGAFMAIDGSIQQLPYQQLTGLGDLLGSFMPSPYHPDYFRPVLTLDPYYDALKRQRPYLEFFSLIQRLNADYNDMGIEPVLTANPFGKTGVGLGFSPDHKLYLDLKSAPALEGVGVYDWGLQPTLEKDKPLCFLTIRPERIADLLTYLDNKFPRTKVSGLPASLFYPSGAEEGRVALPQAPTPS